MGMNLRNIPQPNLLGAPSGIPQYQRMYQNPYNFDGQAQPYRPLPTHPNEYHRPLSPDRNQGIP